jgi:phosphatidylglycerophosphate synthase
LTGTAYIVLAAFRGGLAAIPLWVMWAVILRDVLILGGSAFVYSARRNSAFKPSVWGKLNTFIEIGVVVWFLSGLFGNVLPELYILLLVSLLISAADYIRVGVRMWRMVP